MCHIRHANHAYGRQPHVNIVSQLLLFRAVFLFIYFFFLRSLKECFCRDIDLADFYSRRIIILTYTRRQYKSSVLLFSDACLCGRRRRRRNSISTLTHRQGRTTAPSLSPMPRFFADTMKGGGGGGEEIQNARRRQPAHPPTAR